MLKNGDSSQYYTVTLPATYYNYYYYNNHFTALWILSGTTQVSQYQKKHNTLTPIVVINHSLSASSIYYDPWHPPCSIYVLDSLFAQSLSKFFSVYLLVWYHPLHTQYISSPNRCLLFTAHAQTNATGFDVVPRLVQNEDNTGRHTSSLDGCHPIKTNWCPHLCHPTIFMPDALHGKTLPIYPGLGQAQVC